MGFTHWHYPLVVPTGITQLGDLSPLYKVGGGEEGCKENDPVFLAEKKFFEVLKAQKDARMKQNKPLVFNDDE